MKRFAGLYILALFIIGPTAASSQANPDDIKGTWQLISSKGSINNNAIDQDSSSVYMLKIITPSMFINTVYNKKTNRFKSTVQGTLVVINNIYNETVTNSSIGDFPGHSFSYSYTVAGNILTIQGESNGISLFERWKRIE